MPAASACAIFVQSIAECLCAQNLAALCAPTLKYIAAIRRLHTLAKPMHLAALPFFGLISAYHPISPHLRCSECAGMPATFILPYGQPPAR